MVKYQNRNESVAIGTTSVLISPLQAEDTTEIIAIKNTSTAGQKITLTIGIGTTAVSGAGIVLNPSETYVESTESTFFATYEPISAISDAAGGTIAFYQRIRKGK